MVVNVALELRNTLKQSYSIFGKVVEVEFDESAASEVLFRELGLYPAAPPALPPDLSVRYGPLPKCRGGLANPAIHEELEGGFTVQHGQAAVRWGLSQIRPIIVWLHIRETRSRVRRGLHRVRSMQFATAAESVGQIFHELVLVPFAYFDSEIALLHAASFERSGEGVVAIGGTGGVGKTSLEIHFCLNRGYRFVADDVTVLSSAGCVWPNLAFPKIYAYNLEGNLTLRDRVLGGRGVTDLASWHFRSRWGLHRVRRRMSPLELYGRYNASGAQLTRYFFLAREDRRDFSIEAISAGDIAAMSVAVMEAEYYAFHKHLYWHSVNRRLQNKSPVIELRTVLDRWKALTTKVFSRVDCHVIRIPRAAAHHELLSEVASLVDEAQFAPPNTR